MDIEKIYGLYTQFPEVVIDSRKVKKDCIFFALKGPNFNGNLFAREAIEAGAAYCICDEVSDAKSDRIIFVENVLTTLQHLAKHHREQFNVPFIAITGSNGKTTTKELVHAVLSSKYRCATTVGNLNNHIGIPLTLLSIKKDVEIAVVEMGANHLHEIEGYCKMALPTHGLITNCGKAHLEGFGSVEGVKKGKGELYDFIRETGGTVFINTDYDYLAEMSVGIEHKVSYGTVDADFIGDVASNDPFLAVRITKGISVDVIKTQLAGTYNLPNALVASAIGKTFGIDDENIKRAIEDYVPANSRSQIINRGSNIILLDAYNANPGSMAAAVENFAAMPGEKKIMILGGMKELGAESAKEHAALIALINKFKWEKVAVAGDEFSSVPENILYFKNADAARIWFIKQHFENSTILIKGSRGMAMEKVLD